MLHKKIFSQIVNLIIINTMIMGILEASKDVRAKD